MTELNEQRLRRSLEQAAGEITGAGDPEATWQRVSHRVVQRRRRRRVVSAAAALLVVGLAAAATVPQILGPGVGDEPDVASVDREAEDAEEAAQPPPEGAEDAAREALATETCVNQSAGFAIDHPEGWYTREEGRCTVFGTEPLGEMGEVGGGGMLPGVHIMGDVYDVGFDRHVRDTIEGSTTTDEVLEREERAVDGRRALRIETRESGGAYPQPTRVTTWIVELDARRVLRLHTTDARGSEQYREDLEVLDAMAKSVRPLDHD